MLKKISAAKRILAALAAAVIAASMSGCSYTMTEEDLELQASLIGFWAADNSTGYNEFDENGNLTMMTAVQFTDDFNYLVYYYYPSHDIDEPSYTMTNPPISYTIKKGKFCVEVDGADSFAAVRISGDGNTMNWITDESTDKYIRFSAEEAADMGFPEYNPDTWAEIREMEQESNAEDAASDDAATEDTEAEDTGEENNG